MLINNYFKYICSFIFLFIIPSCTKYYTTQEKDFYKYLYNNYKNYYAYKKDSYDWKGAKIFKNKIKEIEKGKVVLPIDAIKKPNLKKFFSNEDISQIENFKQRMFLVINDINAKTEYPEDVANLQFYHDCWMVEEEYYERFSQIARCKQGFIDTLAYLEFKLLLLNEKERELFLKNLDGDDFEVQVFVRPKKYVIFFDFDSSAITEDSARVMREFLSDVNKISGDYTINIKGHTDRVGDRKYNINLSKRRTNTVKHYLIKNGIDKSKIKESWDGEIDPMVITRNDFKEELNRRVIITIKIEE